VKERLTDPFLSSCTELARRRLNRGEATMPEEHCEVVTALVKEVLYYKEKLSGHHEAVQLNTALEDKLSWLTAEIENQKSTIRRISADMEETRKEVKRYHKDCALHTEEECKKMLRAG